MKCWVGQGGIRVKWVGQGHGERRGQGGVRVGWNSVRVKGKLNSKVRLFFYFSCLKVLLLCSVNIQL